MTAVPKNKILRLLRNLHVNQSKYLSKQLETSHGLDKHLSLYTDMLCAQNSVYPNADST